jgi:hypothetical protein
MERSLNDIIERLDKLERENLRLRRTNVRWKRFAALTFLGLLALNLVCCPLARRVSVSWTRG